MKFRFSLAGWSMALVLPAFPARSETVRFSLDLARRIVGVLSPRGRTRLLGPGFGVAAVLRVAHTRAFPPTAAVRP